MWAILRVPTTDPDGHGWLTFSCLPVSLGFTGVPAAVLDHCSSCNWRIGSPSIANIIVAILGVTAGAPSIPTIANNLIILAIGTGVIVEYEWLSLCRLVIFQEVGDFLAALQKYLD